MILVVELYVGAFSLLCQQGGHFSSAKKDVMGSGKVNALRLLSCMQRLNYLPKGFTYMYFCLVQSIFRLKDYRPTFFWD